MNMKHCTRCQTDKNENEFYKSKANKDGLQTWCKICTKETQAKSRQDSPDKHAKWSRKSYYKNHAKNKELNRKNVELWNKKNPEKAKAIKFEAKLKKYGLTIEQYESILDSQNGACAICKATPQDIREDLSIDHCHKTGRVRGLLCRPCNLGIGNLKDDPSLILNAWRYISA